MRFLLYLTCSVSLVLVCSGLASAQGSLVRTGTAPGSGDAVNSAQRAADTNRANKATENAQRGLGLGSGPSRNPLMGGKQPSLLMREVRQLRVAKVIDGDTILVADQSQAQYQIHLQGIDAPELKQPYGDAAQAHLAELLEGKEVDLNFYGPNALTNGALSNARVFVNGLDAGYEQLSAGFAWFVKEDKKAQTADEREMYQELEQSARNGKLGLWQGAAPQAPWVYRRTVQ